MLPCSCLCTSGRWLLAPPTPHQCFPESCQVLTVPSAACSVPCPPSSSSALELIISANNCKTVAMPDLNSPPLLAPPTPCQLPSWGLPGPNGSFGCSSGPDAGKKPCLLHSGADFQAAAHGIAHAAAGGCDPKESVAHGEPLPEQTPGQSCIPWRGVERSLCRTRAEGELSPVGDTCWSSLLLMDGPCDTVPYWSSS